MSLNRHFELDWNSAAGNDIRVNQTAHGFIVGKAVTYFGGTWVLADIYTHGFCLGLVSKVDGADDFRVRTVGPLVLTGPEWDAAHGTSGGLGASRYYNLHTAGTLNSLLRIDPEQRVLYTMSRFAVIIRIDKPVPFFASPRVISYGRYEFDERLSITSDRPSKITYIVSSGGAPAISKVNVAGRAGVASVTNGNVLNSASNFTLGSITQSLNPGGFPSAGQRYSARWTWMLPALGGGSNTMSLYQGVSLSQGNSGPNAYALLVSRDGLNGGALVLSHLAATIFNNANGSTVIAAGTWYKTRVEVGAPNISEGYLATTGAETLEGSLAINHVANRGVIPYFMISNGGTTIKSVQVDKMEWELFTQ